MEKIEKKYLVSQSKFTFYSLIFVAGAFGAYTLTLRGGVFCNAQTANMALLGIGIATLNTKQIIKYTIPLFAFIFGSCVADIFQNKIFKNKVLYWEKVFICFEIIVLFIIGLLSDSVEDYIVQIVICFLCSMQFYTFRICEGMAMATVFSTNNLRMFITHSIKYIRNKELDDYKIMNRFGNMLLFFILGAIVLTIANNYLLYKSIWISIIPLFFVFMRFFKKK